MKSCDHIMFFAARVSLALSFVLRPSPRIFKQRRDCSQFTPSFVSTLVHFMESHAINIYRYIKHYYSKVQCNLSLPVDLRLSKRL